MGRRLLSLATKTTNVIPDALQFSNPRILANSKTRWELCRALMLLRICSVERVVANSERLLLGSRRMLGSRLWTWLLRPTIYRQFIGGDCAEEMTATVRHLATSRVRPMIMVSLEEPTAAVQQSEVRQHYENNRRILLECIALSSDLALPGTWPQMQIKLTALIPSEALRKLNHDWLAETKGCPNTVPSRLVEHLANALDVKDYNGIPSELGTGLNFLQEILNTAERLKVRLLVDAEYVDVNRGLSAVAYAAALRHNRHSSLIWNTFQCYLKQTPMAFEAAIDYHRAQNIAFGAKLVRGAYMFHERQEAAKQGYPSPVHDCLEDTARCYDAMVEQLLGRAARGEAVQGIVATHNETALQRAVEMMSEMGLSPEDGPVVFGQIYGMGDNLTYPLSRGGYAVYKSIPFGTLEETVPYLCRRAQENRSIFKGTRTERRMLWLALKMKNN